MKTTGLACAYAEPVASTTNTELVPEGNRVRLHSLVWIPVQLGDGLSATSGVQLTDGQSGTVRYRVGYELAAIASQNHIAEFPACDISENGIVFSNGIWVQGRGSGIQAASITFQGIPKQI
ncbi:hypothetical protein CMI37_28300 [Candidatus Pacearchaeota archaeon]|nr:hypothetical protein [Candidatus Pacearchaeota archaeon]|tara:strand:+ start:2326 stop:2688 length:363 start_codon:yes stop_codon:yes gene_type:complete